MKNFTKRKSLILSASLLVFALAYGQQQTVGEGASDPPTGVALAGTLVSAEETKTRVPGLDLAITRNQTNDLLVPYYVEE